MPSPSRNLVLWGALALMCGVLPSLGGCAPKTVKAAAPVAPVAAEEMRPMTIAPDTDATPPAQEAAAPPPTMPAAPAPAPPPVVIQPTRPAAPRRQPAEQASADAETQPAHPPAPQISPQISPGDQATYQRRTNEDISVAEANLQQATGKQLNAAQTDLTEKIRSFVAQARDASKDGDWARAQNLAQKARLLSQELVNTF